MTALDVASRLVELSGENPRLIDLLQEPIRRALGERGSCYSVQVESVGRVGEVLVSITGVRGHVPLFFGAEELEPGYVARVIRETVSRFGL